MKLAIFDVDGTLVDSRAMITAAITRDLADAVVAAPVLQFFVLPAKRLFLRLSVAGRLD